MAYDETHDRLTVETCQGYNAFPDLADGTAEHQKTFNLSTNSQTRHVFRLSALDGTINHLLPCHATPCHDMSCLPLHICSNPFSRGISKSIFILHGMHQQNTYDMCFISSAHRQT